MTSMFTRRRHTHVGPPLFAEERAKQVAFARRAGDMLSEIAREAEALKLPLLAQFVAMARVEADAIGGAKGSDDEHRDDVNT